MKKNSEPGDSLELLLDTMCNTFGGIMFIAIALTVLAAAMPKSTALVTAHDEEMKKIKALKEEISRLESETLETLERRKITEALETQLKNDPRLPMLRKLAAAETEIRRTEIKLAAAAADRQRAEAGLAALTAQAKDCAAGAQKETAVNDSIKEKIRELDRETAFASKTLQSAKPQKSVTFKKLAAAAPGEAPYYIILKGGRIWRTGPEVRPGGILKPHDDVSFKMTGGAYICLPKPEKGADVLSGGAVSAACLGAINGIPQKRYPMFWVYPDSSKEFFELAAELKRQGASYNWNAFEKDQTAVFAVVSSSQVEYEK